MAEAQELEELKLMEEKLQREREECELLEQQIKALGADGSTATPPPPPPPQDASLSDIHRSTANDRARSESRSGSGSRSGSRSASSRSRSRTPPRSRRKRGAKAAKAAKARGGRSGDGGFDFAAAAAGGRATAASKVQIDRNAEAVIAQTRLTGVVPARVLREREKKAKYMSPMYRSANPARGKSGEKYGVVISNFSRAPRFKESYSWVPGPGQYATHDTGFAPATVPSKPDDGGKLGHTWQEQQKSKAILAAAATFKRSGERRGEERARAQAEAADVDAAAAAAAAAAGGDGDEKDSAKTAKAVRAYRASVAREKELKRELAAAHRTISTLRMDMSSQQSQAREQLVELNKQVSSARARQTAAQRKLKEWRAAFEELDRANYQLQRLVREHYPAFQGGASAGRFSEVSDAAAQMDDTMSKARALVKRAGSSEATSVADEHADDARMRALGEQLGAPPPPPPSDGREPAIGTSKPQSLGELGFDVSDIKRFTQKTRRQSEMASLSASAALAQEAKLSEMEAYYGTASKDAMRSLQEGGLATGSAARARSLSPSKRTGRGGAGGLELDVIAEDGAGSVSTRSGPRGPGAGARKVKADAPRLKRRTLVPRAAMTEHLEEDVVTAKETTLDEKLQQIFQYYCSFADRGNVLFLSNNKFYKFVREAGVLESANLTQAEVDIVFNQILSATHKHFGAGQTGTSMLHKGPRLEYQEFTAACAKLAQRQYPEATSAGVALRLMMTNHIMPLYEKLKHKAIFISDVLKEGREQETATFAELFLQPDVLQFFNDNKVPLESLFTRYAMMDTPPAASSKSWADVRESHTQMSMRMFLRFATDFRFMPDTLSRPELIHIFKEANEGDMSDGEFVEVLGLLALHLYGDDPDCPTTLAKVQMLLFKMHERAPLKFEGDEIRMCRVVQRQVRDRLAELSLERSVAHAEEEAADIGSVQDVLATKVLA